MSDKIVIQTTDGNSYSYQKNDKVLATFNFEGIKLNLIKTKYADGNPALVVEDDDGEPWATLSINIPEQAWFLELFSGKTYFIKTWSENEDIAKAVLALGVLEDTTKRLSIGFVQAQIWREV